MVILVALAIAVCFLILLLMRNYYFVRSPLDNIPGPPSASAITGNFLQMIDPHCWEFHRKLRETYGPIAKFHGFFGSRWLHVYDTKALHSILVKDQDLYCRDMRAILAGQMLLGPGILFTYGEHHKKQRKMLNPAFSTAHMRDTTPMFHRISHKLHEAIESRVKDAPKDLDILSWMSRTALEFIGQGGLGHSFDPLVTEAQDEFTEAVRDFVPALGKLGLFRLFLHYAQYFVSARFRRFVLDMLPSKRVQRAKNILDMLRSWTREILEVKKSAIQSGNQELLHMVGEGKDIISILLRANMKAEDEDKLPDDELLAQMANFILAGVETTSAALARTLHLLSMDQDAQNRLRAEILEARERYGEDIPYDELSALPYLDAVCRETLRLHTPVNLSSRQAQQDVVLPLAEPIRAVDGTVLTEIPTPKGTFLFLGLRACNINKAVWGEDAEEWKPERWLNALPSAVEEARIPGIYSNLMTFLSGGNACIGFKFSQLEMKVVLSTLVGSFKLELSETPIHWKFGGVTYPATSHDSTKQEMYIKISMA